MSVYRSLFRLGGRRWPVAIVAVVMLSSFGGVIAARAESGGPHYRLVWADNFNGPAGSLADPSFWTPVTGGDGWGNGELECYTNVPGNADLDGHGHLVLTALSDPGHVCADGSTDAYTSARLDTLDHKSFQYGLIQVRAQMPTGSGAWPAIWAMGADYPQVGWPACGEIDISEVVGSHPDNVYGSVHGQAANGSPYDITRVHTEAKPLSSGFHTYSVLWQPNKLTFSVDNVDYFTVTPKTTAPEGSWPFNKPFFLLLDLAVGGTFPGAPDSAAVWPQRMVVDYVRVSQLTT